MWLMRLMDLRLTELRLMDHFVQRPADHFSGMPSRELLHRRVRGYNPARWIEPECPLTRRSEDGERRNCDGL